VNEHPPQRKVLLALPDNWKNEVHQFLSDKGLEVVQASSFEEAVAIVQSQDLQGMIIVSDWLTSTDGTISDLMEKAPKVVPMVMLIRAGTSYSWFDKLYQPGFREYCTIPLDLDELNLFLKRVGMIGQA
jgi:DNA-binding NtrC family response regulator